MRPAIDEIRRVLRQVMPEYAPISEAPDAGDLAALADAHGATREEIFAADRRKFYKACDADGNIYLVKNPASWEYTSAAPNGMGMRTYVRPKPMRKYSWEQARSEASSSTLMIDGPRGSAGLKF